MMSLRPYFAVAHVVSQHSGRYTPVNLPRSVSALNWEPALGIERWSRSHWDWFLTKERTEPSGLLPWFPNYLARMDPDGAILLSKLHDHFQWCRESGANYFLLCDPFYPEILKEIPQPPIGFSILGNTDVLKMPKISVVGSRRTATRVLTECHRLGYLLASMGITTVSGGAYGCDVATHDGVLSSNKEPLPAIVVFANGLKELYPRGNSNTFSSILNSGGLLLSERLWDQLPRPYDFPIRNRIISGLSMWTLVMGASKHSGAMITARLALDQGREVSVFIPQEASYFCDGSRFLLDDGASFFVSAEEFCQQVAV